MISFRYHIVSIVSVFLALAVGVALGGGPLKGEVDNTLVEQVKADRATKTDLQAQIATLRSTNDFVDAYAEGSAPGLLGDRLDGHAVTLLVLPGAREGDVTALVDLVGAAAGTVAGTFRVGDGLLDTANKQLVDELASQLEDGASGVSLPADAGGYERMGILLARAIGTDKAGGAPVDDTASSILAGLSTAGLMSADGDVEQRGDLVLVVAGPAPDNEEQRQGANAILTSLVKALEANTGGVVLAGPPASARDGVVGAVRADVVAARDVSTVDALGRTAGQVVAVLALAEQATGAAGQYGGVDAADGAMPGGE